MSDNEAGSGCVPADQRAGVQDAQLVQATLSGQRSAFDELIEAHQRRAVAVAYRLLGNLHDALEVTQDAFLRAYRALASLEKPELFGAWLLRIVSNLSLNYRRARRQAVRTSLDECILGEQDERTCEPAGPDATPGQEATASELEGELQRAIADLPERQRLALVLFAIEGLPQRQVAEIMECSLEAVKWHVFAARKLLRERLADYF
jgi:RNA polymerase sigma-70 factor (ECF subfamily)